MTDTNDAVTADRLLHELEGGRMSRTELRRQALIALAKKKLAEKRRIEAGAGPWDNYVPQVIELPNGDTLEFPADMSDDDIRDAIGREYPQYAPPMTGTNEQTLPQVYHRLMNTARRLGAQGNEAAARAAFEEAQKIRAATQATPDQGPATSMEQFGSGLNEGLATLAGAPVDLTTGALNAGIRGFNKLAGTDISEITDPAGGSGTFNSALSPFISEAAPDGPGQRYARRIGQEVGFGAPAAALSAAVPGFGVAARANLPGFMAASTASDVGAGAAGQTAQEVLPGNETAGLLATMAGGMGAASAANRLGRSMPEVPTLSQLSAEVEDAYRGVRDANATLKPEAWQRLSADMHGYLNRSGIDPDNAIDVASFGPVIREVTRGAEVARGTVWDVEKWRRLIGENIASDPQLAKHGQKLKGIVDKFLSSLSKDDLATGNTSVLQKLKKARKKAHQKIKAETIIDPVGRGETRAATTGWGGNQVNAQRQNLRPIYDREVSLRQSGKKAGFTQDEMAALERAVKGTGASNALRNLGRLSPTGSTIGAMLTSGGAVGGVMSPSGPGLYAVPAALGAAGFVAKPMAERMTKKQIKGLLETILAGGMTPHATYAPHLQGNLALELGKQATGRGVSQ